jgi:DNA-binding transcriptional regulator GbsR (MarR family)
MDKEALKLETEHIGLYFDRLGLPPLSGRVLAFLMISDPPYRTFDELVEHLQASKSSVSNSLKMLEQMQIISYKTLPGDRRRHFTVVPEKWYALIEVSDKIRTLIQVFRYVMEVREQAGDDFGQKLEETRDFYLFMEIELPRLFSRWEERKKELKKS